MQQKLGKHSIVLLGVGHTNAHILRMWRMHPIPDSRLTCISNFPVSTYSGMLPGVLAGQYKPAEMEIDLVRLCSVSNSRLIIDAVNGIDREKRSVNFENRAPIPYDYLSIGIGSVPSTDATQFDSDANVLLIKPMQTFLCRLEKCIVDVSHTKTSEIEIAIVGAGIGGTEIAFCLHNRLKENYPDKKFKLTLVNGSDTLITGCRPKTEQLVRRELGKKQIEIVTGKRVINVSQSKMAFDDQTTSNVDIVLWATGATSPAVLEQFDLQKDERGFLATRPTLQTVDDDRIFAVGDTGTVISNATPKAGVYAVRQGPVLWKNIQHALNSAPLESYEPQRSFLKLINTGDGRAVAECKGLSFVGSWCWKWKDHIDTKFMRMYRDYAPMTMAVTTEEDPKMRCVGCGGKLSGAQLSMALGQLKIRNNVQVIVGIDQPDDAAILRTIENQVIVTTDFFASPVNDPFLLGQIAALNGASDCYAMGSQPFAALTMAQVPFGSTRAQHQYLTEMMSGAAKEFAKMETSIVGGHSIEGPRASLGFTVLANPPKQTMLKSGLQAGHDLVLTKPLGSGALLAALMIGQCKGEWFQSMVSSMLRNNQIALELCEKFDVSSMTDVTGFGLAGHLLELLAASDKNASVDLASIPLLDGFAELTLRGIESTMTIENKHIEPFVSADPEKGSHSDTCPSYESLFDPQTCGGLLFAVHPSQTGEAIKLLEGDGFHFATAIGKVDDRTDSDIRIRIN